MEYITLEEFLESSNLKTDINLLLPGLEKTLLSRNITKEDWCRLVSVVDFLSLKLNDTSKAFQMLCSAYLLSALLESGEGLNAVQQIGNEARGDYAFAHGTPTVDTDIGGVQGVQNVANGAGSTAAGAGTYVDWDGTGAYAGGSIGKVTAEDDSPYRETYVNQRGAFGHGCGVVVDGKGGAGFGYATESKGEGAFVEGKRVKVHADAGHGEGSGGEVNGYAAHKEGLNGIADGRHSHVEGAEGRAEGNNSHVEGWGCKTTKSAGASHSGGEVSKTSAYGAFAHGAHLEATRKYQAVFGTANEVNHNAAFIVGVGELDDNDEPLSRSNAFEILYNGTANLFGSPVITKDSVGDIVDDMSSEFVRKKVPTDYDSAYVSSTGRSDILIPLRMIPAASAIARYDTKGILTSNTPDGSYLSDVVNVAYLNSAVTDLKAYVDDAFKKFDIAVIVSTLPAEGENNKIYLVPNIGGEGDDLYTEYIWENNRWEYLSKRTVEIDFSIDDIVSEVLKALPAAEGVGF